MTVAVVGFPRRSLLETAWTACRPRVHSLALHCCCPANQLAASSLRTFRSSRKAPNAGISWSEALSKDQDIGKVIFSGIQPTGVPHLGNYLGALMNWVDMQNAAAPEDTLLFSSVGFHALTMPQDPNVLRRDRRDMLAALLAIGMDPKRCTIFQQENVPQHAELAWIFNCITSIGKLRRITTWKSKVAIARHAQNAASEADASTSEGELNLGLFAYPVLQAADILLYKATHVPVGEDQVQHLELSRDIAHVFNRTHGTNLFPSPQHIITPTKRVLSLRDPSQKMSKSSPDPNSRILLTDTPQQVRKKLQRAVTDDERVLSYDPDARPGVSNLLGILAALRVRSNFAQGRNTPALSPGDIADELNKAKGGAAGAGTLKAEATDAIVEALQPIQAELQRLEKEDGYLDTLAREGAKKAAEIAEHTMCQVRQCTGLA
ncbi:tryptophanyl-tRNA synthetase [Tilletiaria anomala UBC 951]|uniref:Tryptophan--tRNA ligase, mitochondrial n=1 Tax=Tilletiaria anomala (strain ATCC 24038 / CBS 436.72 / UBC 951) TaxID=1037660 RepID=A0A066WGG5_TILAU|nr:tryptophanyl-tRNA synthetase [Tilletiaria anomala UBC 951]KDN52846.1 tryptophanyl-tRNA synthetase [Tilletiaria anomala UBC 951]